MNNIKELNEAWEERRNLRVEGDRLRAECDKLVNIPKADPTVR